jgi:hypothetical protein
MGLTNHHVVKVDDGMDLHKGAGQDHPVPQFIHDWMSQSAPSSLA